MEELDWLEIRERSVKFFQLTEEGRRHVMENDKTTPSRLWNLDFQVRKISDTFFQIIGASERSKEPVVDRKYLKPTEIEIDEEIRELEEEVFRERYGDP